MHRPVRPVRIRELPQLARVLRPVRATTAAENGDDESVAIWAAVPLRRVETLFGCFAPLPRKTDLDVPHRTRIGSCRFLHRVICTCATCRQATGRSMVVAAERLAAMAVDGMSCLTFVVQPNTLTVSAPAPIVCSNPD